MNIIGVEFEVFTQDELEYVVENCKKINNTFVEVESVKFSGGYTASFTDFNEETNKYDAVYINNGEFKIKVSLL